MKGLMRQLAEFIFMPPDTILEDGDTYRYNAQGLIEGVVRPVIKPVRLNRIQVFKDFTLNLAKLSKCTDRQVAAIITDSTLSQVHSIGINGGPKGLADCLCKLDGKYGCIHAEINALIKCRDEHSNKVMFVTLSPCKQCATAIINAPGGFSTVYYMEAWKDETGLKLLKSSGIRVEGV